VRDWWRIDRNDALGGVVDGRVSGTPATRTPHQRQVRRAPRHAATPRHLCGADPAPPRKQLWPVPDLTRAASPWVGVTSSSHRSCRTLLAACGLSDQRTHKVCPSRNHAQVVPCAEQMQHP
jgi:hypothetical protein